MSKALGLAVFLLLLSSSLLLYSFQEFQKRFASVNKELLEQVRAQRELIKSLVSQVRTLEEALSSLTPTVVTSTRVLEVTRTLLTTVTEATTLTATRFLTFFSTLTSLITVTSTKILTITYFSTSTATVTETDTVYRTLTTVYFTCPMRGFSTYVREWMLYVETLKPGWTAAATCTGPGTLALGTYVYWISLSSAGLRRIIVQQADQILPCPAGITYVNSHKTPVTVTLAVVGPARASLGLAPPPSSATLLG